MNSKELYNNEIINILIKFVIYRRPPTNVGVWKIEDLTWKLVEYLPHTIEK